MYKRLLVPTDGSEITDQAIRTATQLARTLGATVEALCVKEPLPYGAISEMQPVPPQEFFDNQERIAVKRLAAVQAACQAAGVECNGQTIEAGHAWEAIVEHAERQGCDLIVMASHGRRGVSALLLGSETQKVLSHTKVPVLVVH